jgi:hypothetical protein
MSTDPATPLTLNALAAELAEVKALERAHQEKVVELERANAGLREELTALRRSQTAAIPSAGRTGRTKRQIPPSTSRRGLLHLGGAAAVATLGAGVLLGERSGTALAAPHHIASAPYEGDATGAGTTGLKGIGSSGAGGVYGFSDTFIAVEGQSGSGIGVSGTGSIYGVAGLCDTTSGIGVFGSSTSHTGVKGCLVLQAALGCWAIPAAAPACTGPPTLALGYRLIRALARHCRPSRTAASE